MILKASQEQLKRYSVLNAMLLRSSAHFLIGLFFVAVVVELWQQTHRQREQTCGCQGGGGGGMDPG